MVFVGLDYKGEQFDSSIDKFGYTEAMRIALMATLILASSAHAGLHYSGEPFSDLPAQWRGFLPDQRLLRMLPVPTGPNQPPNPLRDPYRAAAEKLANEKRPLTPDEAADLGALRLRLGQVDAAIEVLRNAQRQHPDHFRLTSNLGTAWHVQGDLDQAALMLREAVRLAPAKLRKAEEWHLKLVMLRRGEAKGTQSLDNLFGVNYEDDPVAVRKKLPADAVANLQLMALWLPGDGRLLWQLGELAHILGDDRTAAAILDGCVAEFSMSEAILRKHRAEYRANADKLAKDQPQGRGDVQTSHDSGHEPAIVFRSPRPLPRRLDSMQLGPVRADGSNELPWWLLVETTMDRNFRPIFAKRLKEMDGKRVNLIGYMQPIGDELETGAFLLIEYPIGCWFCEVPETTGIVLVELPENKLTALTRTVIKVDGTLVLNSKDPEQFLYTIRDAKVGVVD